MKTVLLSLALASSVLLSGCVVSVGGGSDSHYGADWEDREKWVLLTLTNCSKSKTALIAYFTTVLKKQWATV